MLPGMGRRDFVRASAGASLGVMTAGGLFKAAEAAAAPGPGAAGGPGSLAPYVGAGSTAAIQPFPPSGGAGWAGGAPPVPAPRGGGGPGPAKGEAGRDALLRARLRRAQVPGAV